MSILSRNRLPLAAIAVWLAGCSAISPTSSHQSSIEPSFCEERIDPCEIGEIMDFYETARKLPAGELGRAHERAKQNFAKNRNDMNRARLILLLILPNSQPRDLPAALHLLNEWPRDNKPASLQGFRNLLAGLLAEQQRLNHSVEELAQKLKEEQKRGETLQSQIEAIKNMEKNLLKEL